METDDNILQVNGEAQNEASAPQEQETVVAEQPQLLDEVGEILERLGEILERLGVSDSVAASTRALLDTVKGGKAPGENFVKLIVSALSHDEDIKNAEAAGYLRGRNEVIEAATKVDNDQEPTPVNFPIYRKRSFWD